MIRFLHIRECDDEGELLNSGGCTIAYTVSPEMDAICVHTAICHPKDHFVKAFGRKLAEERLKNDKEGPLDIVPFSHPYSKAVRLWFMQYFDVGLSFNGKHYMTDWTIQSFENADDEFELEEPPLFKEEDFASEAV